ncbi:MAG: amidohydrolase family protein, partial [candidate division Zixibacteria bacterium]|nr:amidohydrolase family protein [candidate division Zixibacteria bacterium]
EQFQPDSKTAGDLLKLGFTTVQSVDRDGIFRGRGLVVSLGQGLPNDLVVRPHSWHFLSFDKGSSKQEYPTSQMGAIALIRQTLLDADWYGRAHTAYQKNQRQERPETNLALEALQTVTGETVIFETDDCLSLLRADRIAREFGFNIVHVGSGLEFEGIDGIKAAGHTVIVPVDFPETPELTSLGDEADVSLQTLRRWDWAPSNPAILEQNRVKFAFTTTGLEKKEDFIANVRRAIKRGLSERTALAALTTVPAEVCGVAQLLGSLEPGKLADFVVCDGNIFDEQTTVYAVYTHGRKTEFVPFDEVSFAGYYFGELMGKRVALKIKDKVHAKERRISGKLTSGTNSSELMNASHDRDLLSFSIALDSLGSAGVARFALRKEGDRLNGRVAFADGRWQTWSAGRVEKPATDTTSDQNDAEIKDYEEERENQSTGPDTLIARLTHPNMAYGFVTLPQQENVLVKNATIWTSDSLGVLDNADLLIRDGRIEAVGRNLKAPSGYRVIDATGKHVTAGIIDEHSHMCLSGDINEGSDAISSEVRASDIIEPDDISIYRSLAGGVTAARVLHGSANPIGGQAQIIKLRWGGSSEEMKFTQAPPSIKFALGENVKQSGWGDQFNIRYPQTRMGVETIIRDAFQTAREYEAEWNNYNALDRKSRESTIPPRRNLRLEALVEVLHSRMFITCHAYVQSEILMMMQLAADYGITIATFVHVLEGYKVADEMVKYHVGGGSAPDWWAYKFEVYDAIPQNPGLMHQRGVLVSINSDSPQLQRLLNQAAAKSVMYTGMSQEDALDMVTINPARQLKADQYIGSLKVGKDADFVIWSGNPLSVYSHPEQTWIDGKKYFDIEDDARCRAQVDGEKNKLIQKVLSQPEEKRDWDDRKRGWGRPHEKGASDENTY